MMAAMSDEQLTKNLAAMSVLYPQHSGTCTVALEAIRERDSLRAELAARGEPVAWAMYNQSGKLITISDWALKEEQDDHCREVWKGASPLYARNAIAPPYDVRQLPGYAWSNDVLTVFSANGRTAYAERGGCESWFAGSAGARPMGYGSYVTREAAEKAASEFVTKDATPC